MATINTVLGTCEPKELGFTLIHEHLMAGMPGWEFDNVGFDRRREVATAVEKLREIKALGVSSFVDPCPMELGRDPEFAAEVAGKSGMQVIIATGLYNDALGIPSHFRMLPVDDIAEVYVRELTGVPREEIIGKTKEIFLPGGFAQSLERFERILKEGRLGPYELEVTTPLVV